MKRLLVLILVAGFLAGSFIGCNDDAKERMALTAVKLAAMEYGTGAQGWFKWGEREQAAYDLIMTGDISKTFIDAVESDIRARFKNPVAAQGVIELIHEAGLQFDTAGDLIATVENRYPVKFLQAAAEGFRLGVTTVIAK